MVKFSIVVPAYNAAAFLGRSLGSVQAQTHALWETVVVDDGSTDDTWDVLQRVAAQDARVHVVHQKNMGQFYARQVGIKAATGEYVIFLDSDDELEPNCLSSIAAVLEQADYDMILYMAQKVVDGKITDQTVGFLGENARQLDVQWLRENVLRCNDLNSLCTKAFRRTLFLEDDTDYTSFMGMHCGEDKVQLLYPLTKAKKIAYIPDRLYRYHFRSDSVMHQMQPEKIPRALAGEMFGMLRSYMVLWGMDDEEHRKMLGLYQLRIFLEVYFNTKRQCSNAMQRRQVRHFPWKQHLDPEMLREMPRLQRELTMRERLKLAVAVFRL